MSYILDALRKSEQQRQAADPESVTDRILVNQPPVQANTKKWLALLVFVNLLALAYFFGFVNKANRPRSEIPKKANTSVLAQPANPVDTPPTVVSTPSPAPQIAGEIQSVPAQMLNNSGSVEPTSIAQMMSVDEDINVRQKPVKPVPEKKTIAIKKPPVIRSGHARNESAYAGNMAVENAYRSDMPAEIERDNDRPVIAGQSRPKLTINVYSYAPQPQDRFVMINMTKYKVGQLIKDGIKLKEIHPNHIVLQQGSTTFKMDRP